jgi:two-component system cell cycle response regulator
MKLRTRLSAAFLFVVLIPVVVGSVIVSIVVPHVLQGQLDSRLRAARTSVTDVLTARCVEAGEIVQRLGLQVATEGPQAAVASLVNSHTVDYAVVDSTSGAVVASAGSLAAPGTRTPLPAALTSCTNGSGASYAIGASASLDIGGQVSLRSVAVAWAVTSTTAASVRAGLDGQPAVTLVAGHTVVSSTLSSAAADRQLRAATSTAVMHNVGSRSLAVTAASAGQPYTVIVSDPVPNTTKLTLSLLAVIVVAVVAALAIGRLLARLISRPITALSSAASRVASGDLDVEIPVNSRDEVGQLAEAFNHMTGELRTYIGQLERSRDELHQNLDRLGATLTHTHDLEGILAVVLDTAIGSVQACGGAILFLDKTREHLEVTVARGAAAEILGPDTTMSVGVGVSGTVARTGEAVRGTTGEGPGLRLAPEEPQASSVISVPLRQSGRVVGVLTLYDKDGDRPFTAYDLETILAFASQASVAIDNVMLHQEAQRLSLTDPMTGLWNYRYLTLALGHEIERASRFGHSLAVLMLDLDNFKSINDKHGHQSGDAVLIELARRMSAQVREVDTVARYGGEEFVVVLPETDAAGAARAAERLVEQIRATPFRTSQGLSLPVTASVGAAVFPQHGRTPSDLLRRVDSALYEAKNQGRNRWRFARDVSPGEAVGAAAAAGLVVPDAANTTLPLDPRVLVVPEVAHVRDTGAGSPRRPEG